MALPGGYTKLAYIESTGTQYINTGFIPNNNTKAVCDAELISGTNNISVPFGTYESGSNRFALMYHHQLGWTHWVGGASGQCAGEQLGRHTFTLTGTSLIVDSATKTFTTAAFTGSVPMFIFGINYQGSLDYAASMRLYSCKIYDNGALVRDFVPCKNASGTVGLYDDANGVFYSNAGSGTFSYGEIEPSGDHRTMVDGVIWGVPSGRCLVDGVGYSIQKGRTLVDGVGYDVAFGPSGPVAGDVTVGSSVWTNVNGVRTEFLVVHQGIPDASVYDASCDGTWVLMKDCYTKMAFASNRANIYESSEVHSYLISTFLGLFDSGIKARIKTAKIPYRKGGGSGGTLQQGANGLSTQIFLLSNEEVGKHDVNYSGEGVALSYFAGCTDSKRIAYQSGVTTTWWLRSMITSSTNQSCYVMKSGAVVAAGTTNSNSVRPAFILDSSAAIDPNTFDILG